MEFSYDADSMRYGMCRHRTFLQFHPHLIPVITPPPPQDSPKHILNSLDDECIQRIFGFLIGDVSDYFNAAEVCTRFQKNAIKCFPSIYKDFSIECSEEFVPVNRVKDFLKIFGHLIRSIYWDKCYNDMHRDCEIFGAIVNFCGKNLLGLRILNHNMDFNMGYQFKVLEELGLYHCNIVNFKPPPTLKKLDMRGFMGDFDWMSETYTDLTEISLYNFNRLNNEVLIRFQELNRQLTLMDLCGNKNVTSTVFQGIAKRLPNLANLCFDFSFDRDDENLRRKLEVDIMHLSELRQLNTLYAMNIDISICSLIDSLAANNISIEKLLINTLDSSIAKTITKFENMKALCFTNEVTSASMVIYLVKQLPKLEKLFINRGCYEGFTLADIFQILEHGKNLKILNIWDDNLKIDSNDLLNNLWELVKDKVHLRLDVKEINMLVEKRRFGPYIPIHKMHMRQPWLHINSRQY